MEQRGEIPFGSKADHLPLFLNSELVAKVLGVSPSSGYEPMQGPDFPVLPTGCVSSASREISEPISAIYLTRHSGNC